MQCKRISTTFGGKRLLFILVIFISIVLRLFLTPIAHHEDLLANASWGQWIYNNGAAGFYQNEKWIYAWPSQPPVISYLNKLNYDIYDSILLRISYVEAVIKTHNLSPSYFQSYFNFVNWFGHTYYGETNLTNGFLISMKIIPIICDLLIGFLIYLLANSAKYRRPVLLSALYLLSPFSWYLSALWGQYDQMGFLLFFISLIFVNKKYFIPSVILVLISLQVKPTVMYLLPFYAIYFLTNGPKKWEILGALMTSILLTLLSISIFSRANPLAYGYQVMLPKIFFEDRMDNIAMHAFNFWQIFFPDGRGMTVRLFNIPIYYFGYLVYIIANLLAIKIMIGAKTLKNIFLGSFIVASGSYLFGIGMLDRYYFAGVTLLLALCIYKPTLIKWYILTSTLFFINLFYSWGFPIYDRYHVWENLSLVRLLSFAQVAIFMLCLKELGLFRFALLKLETQNNPNKV